MHQVNHSTEILIIGAGLAGLTAASQLYKAGHRVLVLDKARGVGGRMATRRMGGATFDHGAQFMTAKGSRFSEAIDHWRINNVVKAWFERSAGGHTRWRGNPSMTAVAKYLARQVTVRLEARVTRIQLDPSEWSVSVESGDRVKAHKILLTPPVPQSMELLQAGGIDVPAPLLRRLKHITYDPCLAVLAVLDGASQIPPPGGFAPDHGPIAWMADNQMKGISAIPAITIHASADFSRDHWDRDRNEAGQELLRAANPWLGGNVIDFQIHGWRYSKPVYCEQSPYVILHENPLLLCAGDAFGGPRVEGAAVSGWTAAEILIR